MPAKNSVMATEVRAPECAPAAAPEHEIRVLIVDDQRLMRDGLRMLIESRPGMRVVGEAADRLQALALARREDPDIVLLELDLTSGSGLDVLADLAASGHARTIVLTRLQDPEAHRRAVMAGATGLVFKSQPGDVLLRAIERVHAGEAWLDHRTTATLIRGISRPPRADEEAARIATLTAREREIIGVVCAGLKNRQIAEKLFISEATVRNHLTSILSKLGLADRFELAIYAYRHRLGAPPPPAGS